MLYTEMMKGLQYLLTPHLKFIHSRMLSETTMAITTITGLPVLALTTLTPYTLLCACASGFKRIIKWQLLNHTTLLSINVLIQPWFPWISYFKGYKWYNRTYFVSGEFVEFDIMQSNSGYYFENTLIQIQLSKLLSARCKIINQESLMLVIDHYALNVKSALCMLITWCHSVHSQQSHEPRQWCARPTRICGPAIPPVPVKHEELISITWAYRTIDKTETKQIEKH